MMISQIGKRQKGKRASLKTHAFTLVELIVVMALLSAIFAVSAPSLTRFFKGRSTLEEARRFLALTRYGREQAISLSMPLGIWVDVNLHYYTLLPMPGYDVDTEKEVSFTYDENLHLEFVHTQNVNTNEPIILFLPDGSLDESSVFAIQVQEAEIQNVIEDPLFIVQDEYGNGYEILREENYERYRNSQSILSDLR